HLSLMRLLGADGAYCCDRFFFCDRGARRGLHSFPTRRSSDLIVRDAVYVIRIVAGDARRDRMLGADRLSLAEDPDPVAGLVRHRDRTTPRLNSRHGTTYCAVLFLTREKRHTPRHDDLQSAKQT